ncbi:Glycosyl transferase, family 2 domain protein [Rhodopirellula maiorica SM1]|uniref:Glycosyl transferase, family 2 domain protein n=1 Tax=Rhodopirellula maiorica SM1 TaxID=1265738 RepID=M5S6Q6_9BACT|nr:glycosyltransferase family 2 protein [Rhodopirellula maiorica]EMI21864.1 Glycosyl transferase, family 2 domain protein [Rhodopirellula maiorica SM1]
MPVISAIVICRNEADNILRCIQSLDWCDEVIVVDDNSTDGTADIARNAGAKVINHPFESFASQRNWAMCQPVVQGEWILHFDADETSSPSFASAVNDAIRTASNDCVAFALCRKTMFHGAWLKYSDGFPVWIMRLVRRNTVLFEDSGHGEVPIPKIAGTLPKIDEPFIHDAFSKGLSNWVERHNKYSSYEAGHERQSEQPLMFRQIISTDRAIRRRALRGLSRRLPARPVMRFLYQYVLKFGFLDGRPGLQFCLLMAIYEWFIVLKKNELESA